MYNSKNFAALDDSEHRLEDPAYIQSPYPRFYQGLWEEPESNEFEENSPSGSSSTNNRSNEHYDLDCTLWVGNLDGRVSETVLFELFCQIGTIRNITFPQKKVDGDQATTFCFINFMVADSVPKSIEIMQGTTLFGRRLFLKCRPNSIHSLKPTTTTNKKPNRVVHLSTTKTFSNQNAQNYQSQKCQKSSPMENQNEDGNSSGSHSKSDYGDNSNTDSPPTKKKFSPIRAPTPIIDTKNNNNKKKNNKQAGGRLKFSNQTPTDNTATKKASNRKVIIKSAAGTKVPTVTVSEPVEPSVNSVVVKKSRPKNISNLDDDNNNNNNKKKEKDDKVNSSNKSQTTSLQSDTKSRGGSGTKSTIENNKNITLPTKTKAKVTTCNKTSALLPKSAKLTSESLLVKQKRNVTATNPVPTTPNSSKIINNQSNINQNQVSPYPQQQQQQYGGVPNFNEGGRYPAYNPRFHGPQATAAVVDQNQNHVRPHFSYYNSRYRFHGHPSQQHEYHPQQQQQQQYGYHQQQQYASTTFPLNYNPNYYQYYDYGNGPHNNNTNNPRYLNPMQQQQQYTPRCTTTNTVNHAYTGGGGGPRYANRQYIRPDLNLQQQQQAPPPQQRQFNINNNMYQHNNKTNTSGTTTGRDERERSHFERSPRQSRSYSRSPRSRSGSRRRKFSRFERSRSSSYEESYSHSRNRSRYRSRSADSRSSSNKSHKRRSRSNSRENYRRVENNNNNELRDVEPNSSSNIPSESRSTTTTTTTAAAAKKVGRVSIKKVATKNTKSSSSEDDEDDSDEESMDESTVEVNTIEKVKDSSSSSSSSSETSDSDDDDSDDDDNEENVSVQKSKIPEKAVTNNSGQNTKTLTTTKVVRKVKTIRKYDPTHPDM